MTDLDTLSSRRVDPRPTEAGLADARQRGQRHRNRRTVGLAVTAVAAAAVSGALTLTGAGPGESTNRLRVVPATSPTATASLPVVGSVYGVDVTYLPAGWAARSKLNRFPTVKDPTGASPTIPETLGGTGIDQVFGPPLPPNNGFTPQATIAVQRGATADLEQLAANNSLAVSWTQVQDHRALLRQRYTSDTDPKNNIISSSNAYSLEWIPTPGVTVSVHVARTRDGAAVAQRIAEGLRVGHPTAPADKAAATTAIDSAVRRAFTGGQPDATVLSGIQDGQDLAKVLQQLKASNGDVAASSRVTRLGQVFFFDAQHATVDASISYTFNGSTGGMRDLYMVDDGTGWKVSRADFCGLIQTLATCPGT